MMRLYQKEINKKIGFSSGWDGHITTGTSMIFSTQNSSLFQVDTALKRSVPTVSWLDPKLRTTVRLHIECREDDAAWHGNHHHQYLSRRCGARRIL